MHYIANVDKRGQYPFTPLTERLTMSTLNAIEAFIKEDPLIRASDIAVHLDGSVVSDEITGQSRWSVYSTVVVDFNGHFVEFIEEDGATEYQDTEQVIVEFYPVEPYEVTVTKYKKVTE